nr:hypothetical protein [Tanacetum cinerariifolium]
MSAKDSIAIETCELSKEEFNEFLVLYSIPSSYHVILNKSNQTVLNAPPRYVGLYTHSFSLANLRLRLTKFFCEASLMFLRLNMLLPVDYAKDEEDLSLIPKEPSLAFGTGFPSNRKCKTKGGSSRPPVKRKLDLGSSTARATRAKTSVSKDDLPFLILSDEDKGLFDVPEVKYATACHLKISNITPPAWKNHLDNYMDSKLLDLYDRCYARQAFVDNAVNRRSHELLGVIEKLRGECDMIKERERAREEESEGLQAKCEAAMYNFEKNQTVVASLVSCPWPSWKWQYLDISHDRLLPNIRGGCLKLLATFFMARISLGLLDRLESSS